MNVNDVVQIRIEDARRRVEAARRRRAELDAARQAGLVARHRTKLARQDAGVATPEPTEGAKAMTLSPAEQATQRIIDTAQQQPTVAELWTAAYPTMRLILDRVIRANRATERPVVNIARLEQVRLRLGQLDRGTYQPCTRSSGVTPVDDPSSALSLVRSVLNVTSVGDPTLGLLYRLASGLANASYEHHQRIAARLAALENQ